MSAKFQVVNDNWQRTGKQTNKSGNNCRVVRLNHKSSLDKHKPLQGKIKEAVADDAMKEARRNVILSQEESRKD